MALEYTREHMKGWPDELRIAPRGWWEVACMGAAPPALGLSRVIRPGKNKLDAARLRNLVQADVLADLTTLDLDGNRIGAEGVRYLCEATHLTALRYLNLAENQIQAEGARALARARHMAKLD
jgi:hypothetical protein